MDKETLDAQIWELRVSLMRLAASILRHPQNAEDAVSDAILAAYRKRDTLRSDAALKPWLMRITARCCYDQLRRRRREQERMPEQPLMGEPVQDTVWELLLRLPPGQTQVLTLYYYEGFSTQDIAEVLGLTRPTVSMRLSRGRAKLKELLEAEREENGESSGF